MSRKYFIIFILFISVTTGVFYFFENASADTTPCGIPEQCSVLGCNGVPTGPSVDCTCTGTSSCPTGGNFICAPPGVPPDRISCSGGQTCQCDHLVCSNNACVVVAGDGISSCTTDADCAPPVLCTSATNACGQTNPGTMVGDVCNAVTPPNPAGYGTSCTVTSTPNVCGQTASATGTIQCDGTTCSATQPAPPPNPSGYGTVCFAASVPNACGASATNSGTIQCDGTTCSAGTTPLPTPIPTTCSNACGMTATTTCWAVCVPPPDSNCAAPPIVTISASPNPISYNTATTIIWSSTDATFCTVSPGGGTGTSGTMATATLTVNTTYTASCTGPGGSGSNSVTVIVSAPTLSVSSFSASSSSGTAPLSSTLSASVGGTATGTINYSFWWNCPSSSYAGTIVLDAITACGNPDGVAGNAVGNKFDGVSTNPQNSISHTYTTAGTYTPLVIVERGGLANRATTTVTVTAAPVLTITTRPTGGTITTVDGKINCGTSTTTCSATYAIGDPIAINAVADPGYTFSSWGGDCLGVIGTRCPAIGTMTMTSNRTVSVTFTAVAPGLSTVQVTEPNYCSSSFVSTLSAIVTWAYSSAAGQNAYQVQVDNWAGTFSPPLVDSGKVIPSIATSYNALGLAYNTRYKARVMVWDTNGTPSPWVGQTVCFGPGCAVDNLSWTTPLHSYPVYRQFTWSPTTVRVNQPVRFFNQSTCYNASNLATPCSSWNYDFDYNTGVDSTANPNPVHTYLTNGAYSVVETITDANSYTCLNSSNPISPVPITVGNQIIWREVSPR